jgi:hypothetical protein
MNDVASLIETINPPGVQKPNRLALFTSIRDVGTIVKADALKAFNAHFPYLADEVKLEEHGAALLVPHLVDDTSGEYRDRVSTASFFLMRAGERAYILEQLTAHFADRYIVLDEFLHVYVKVRDLEERDRHWLLQFLDELVNPNVSLSVVEWYKFIESVITHEALAMNLLTSNSDSFSANIAKLNGRLKLDGSTLNDIVIAKPKLDGYWMLDGTLALSGTKITLPASGYVRIPAKLGAGVLDCFALSLGTSHLEEYVARVILNGAAKLNRSENLSGFGRINEKLSTNVKYSVESDASLDDTLTTRAHAALGDSANVAVRRLNGSLRLDGRRKLGHGLIDTTACKARTKINDGYVSRQKLNGAIFLDGSEKLSGFGRLNYRFRMRMRYDRRLNGSYRLDGNIKLNSGVLIPA